MKGKEKTSQRLMDETDQGITLPFAKMNLIEEVTQNSTLSDTQQQIIPNKPSSPPPDSVKRLIYPPLLDDTVDKDKTKFFLSSSPPPVLFPTTSADNGAEMLEDPKYYSASSIPSDTSLFESRSLAGEFARASAIFPREDDDIRQVSALHAELLDGI